MRVCVTFSTLSSAACPGEGRTAPLTPACAYKGGHTSGTSLQEEAALRRQALKALCFHLAVWLVEMLPIPQQLFGALGDICGFLQL